MDLTTSSPREKSTISSAVDALKSTDAQWDTYLESVKQSREVQLKIKSLPAEMRILIFRHYLAPEQCDCFDASALVAALRPDADMYAEVLEVFFSVRKLRVSVGNKRAIMNTSRDVFTRVTSLEVAYSVELSTTSWKWEFITHLPVPLLRKFTNLKSITLTTSATVLHPVAQKKLGQCAKDLIINVPNLSQLTIHLPLSLANLYDALLTEPNYLFEPTKTINTATHTRQTFLPSPHKDCIAMQWKASPSSPVTPFSHPNSSNLPRLSWTDHTHFRSTPWRNCNTLFTFLTLYHRIEFWYEEWTSFAGFNPRRTLLLCPVDECVCKGLVAMRCPIEKKMRKNEGWLVVRPEAYMRELTREEEDEEREVFRVPAELSLDSLRAARDAS